MNQSDKDFSQSVTQDPEVNSELKSSESVQENNAPAVINTQPKEKDSDRKAAFAEIFHKMDNYFLDDKFDSQDKSLVDLSSIYKDAADKFKAGMLVVGKIVDKDSRGILVSIQYKSDGQIPGYEFAPSEYSKLKVGDDVEVMIDSLEDGEGNLILSYQKAKSIKIWNEVNKIFETNGSISGKVTHKVKGGLSMDIGIPAFLPGSQIDVTKVSDFDQYLGQEVFCKIIKINKKRGNVIVSRRAYLEEERNEERRKSLDNLAEGQVIRGTVKNITTYGAFVDIGGIDGLLHITDMSWGRISHPSELIKIGDEINVKILSFDKENAKISLGIKQLYDNPWQDADKLFKEGSLVKGKISAITDYGVFVELAPGVEGLVHISEVSWTERVQDLANRYKVGEEIEVVILGVEKNERRMSLSIKRKEVDPWKAAFEKIKVGDRISGTVSNVTDFGVFVRVAPGVDGLVHVSDISWTDHIDSPKEKFKKGATVDVIVLSIEEDKHRISLGIKQAQKDPWSNIEQDFVVGSLVTGIVSKVTNFGVFVKFDNGIEGLAYISELSDKEVTDASKIVTVGATETFRVIKASSAERKLGLSLKAVKNNTPISSTKPEMSVKPRKHVEPAVHHEPREFESEGSSSKSSLQLALEKMKKNKDDDKSDN